MLLTERTARPVTALILGGALVLGACARPAGQGEYSERYGEAYDLNQARQVAYKSPEDFLTDLGRVFAAETEETVTFAFDSARLDASARQALRGQAEWLKANPEVRMTVTGHTDLVGGESYNDRLGLRRARAVVRQLGRLGVDTGRLDAVGSAGETMPVVETESRERRNRRATTEVAGFRRNFVGTGMDGRRARLIYQGYVAADGD